MTTADEIGRERDYFRQQADSLGSRVLRLLAERDGAALDARRSRLVAALVRRTNGVCDSVADPGALGALFLDSLLDVVRFDRGAILRHEPSSGAFAALHVRGFPTASPPHFPALTTPPTVLVVNGTTPTSPIVEGLRAGIGVLYFLWAYDPSSRYALILGNRKDLGILGRLQEGDSEVVAAALDVLCSAIRRKEAENALKEAKLLLEARVRFRTRELSDEIAERRTAQRNLTASEERLRGAIEGFQDGFALFDADDRIVMANEAYKRVNPWAEEVLRRRCTFEEVLRINIARGNIREAEGREEDYVRQRLAWHRSPGAQTVIYTTATGRKMLIHESRTPRGDTAIAFSDLTDLMNAQEQARRLQSELAHVARLNTMGEMAAGFAHEINQPLAAISSYAMGCVRRVKAGKGDLEEITDVLDRIAEQAERAGEINRRIRRFLQKEDFDRLPVDVNRTIEAAVGLLTAIAEEHEVAVGLDLDPGAPMAMADAVQIQQIVLNLARNGIEAIPLKAGGPRSVTVKTRQTGDEVRIDVCDTGCGLSADVRERLFEPFFTTKEAGMGVGLLVCRRIVEAHGGRLRVEANAGAGTTAWFVLPAIEGAPPDEGGRPGGATAMAPRSAAD